MATNLCICNLHKNLESQKKNSLGVFNPKSTRFISINFGMGKNINLLLSKLQCSDAYKTVWILNGTRYIIKEGRQF